VSLHMLLASQLAVHMLLASQLAVHMLLASQLAMSNVRQTRLLINEQSLFPRLPNLPGVNQLRCPMSSSQCKIRPQYFGIRCVVTAR